MFLDVGHHCGVTPDTAFSDMVARQPLPPGLATMSSRIVLSIGFVGEGVQQPSISVNAEYVNECYDKVHSSNDT